MSLLSKTCGLPCLLEKAFNKEMQMLTAGDQHSELLSIKGIQEGEQMAIKGTYKTAFETPTMH